MSTTPSLSEGREASIVEEGRFYRTLGQGSERALFAKMQERADADSEYRAALGLWLKRGSTLRLRDLCASFGSYWRDLAFANVVDGLDSARARFRQA